MSRRRSPRSRSASGPAGSTAPGPAISAAAEDSVRQLIADGDHVTALTLAKEIHHASGTAASEALLIDAYVERIHALTQRNLTVEAKSLTDLVRRRYPSARTRLASLTTPDAAKTPSLDELVRPLNDPALGGPARAAIDRSLRCGVWDLAALAGCDALAQDHAHRRAAAALDAAFVTATSGPVTDDTLRLPEVSHRSPLAPWKLLTCAVASFYRDEGEACERYLEGIDPESVPARLVPALRAMVTDDETRPLTPAAARLRAQITETSTQRRGLEALDQAFESGNPGHILKAIRPVVYQCQRTAPERLDTLRQHISVRCVVAGLDPAKVLKAMGGPSRHDATFLRLFARAMEESRALDDVVAACSLWEEFRGAAVKEGWFAANGAEAAALSLRMAELLRRLPDGLLTQLQRSAGSQATHGGDTPAYLRPEELYQRACVLDPHPEAFSLWLGWAEQQPGTRAKRVAAAWHKIRPEDVEPVAHLMHEAEAHGRFSSALTYIAKVEQLDPLYPGLRGTWPRLLVGNALRHLQQHKPWLAADDLARMSALPQAREGDRPALLAALGYVASVARGDDEPAAAHLSEVERLLGSSPAAAVLTFAVAAAARQRAGPLGSVRALSSAERASLPGVLARIAALAADVRLKLEIPAPWMVEVTKQFPANQNTLDTDQLRGLAELALAAGRGDLAYVVTAAGLERGGATDVRFLFLRAQSVTGQLVRRVVCARAAVELARWRQDPALVEEAATLVRGQFEFDDLTLTLDQARDVLARETAAQKPPRRNRPGPDYGDLVGGTCQCVRCRRARGEDIDPLDTFDPLDFDEDDFDEFDEFDGLEDNAGAGFEGLPGMPPDIAELFAAEVKDAIGRGESVDEFVARVVAGGPSRKRRTKRKRR